MLPLGLTKPSVNLRQCFSRVSVPHCPKFRLIVSSSLCRREGGYYRVTEEEKARFLADGWVHVLSIPLALPVERRSHAWLLTWNAMRQTMNTDMFTCVEYYPRVRIRNWICYCVYYVNVVDDALLLKMKWSNWSGPTTNSWPKKQSTPRIWGRTSAVSFKAEARFHAWDQTSIYHTRG